MRTSEPRIKPVPESSFNDDQKQTFKAQLEQGRVLNIFKTLANHEKLAKRWLVKRGDPPALLGRP